MVTGNYVQDINASDKVVSEAMMMADFFVNGMMSD